MSRWFGLACLGVACVLILGSARGQGDPKKSEADAIFKKLDTNSDGKLSRDEFLKLADLGKDKAKAQKFLEKIYDKLDPQKKGLTQDQFREFMERKKKKDATG